MARVFTNCPGDLGSIPGRVIPKTPKMVLNASLLNTQHYKVRIKDKVEQSKNGVAPSPTPWCSSNRKGSLLVTLDYGRQLYIFYYNHLYSSPKMDWSLNNSLRLMCHYNWFIVINRLRADKEKKQKVPRKNNYRRRLRRWHSATGQYTQPSRNTTA